MAAKVMNQLATANQLMTKLGGIDDKSVRCAHNNEQCFISIREDSYPTVVYKA